MVDGTSRASRNILGKIFLSLLLINLSHPLAGIANLPTQFILKDSLHAKPTDIAIFNAYVSVPIALAWLAGFIRDSGRTLLVDRLYVIGGTLAGTACYLFLAAGVSSYTGLLTATFVAAVSFVLAETTVQARMVQFSKTHALEDNSSVVWNSAEHLPSIVSYLMGAWLLSTFGASGMFLVCAGFSLLVLLACRDYVVTNGTDQSKVHESSVRLRTSAKSLRDSFRRPAFPLALVIIFLFTFSPGWQTPLLYYLTEKVGLSKSEFALFWALVSASTIAGAILFGICSRFTSPRRLLWICTALMVVQSPIPLVISNAFTGYIIAVVSGLMYGFAIASYWALLIRVGPKGLEGTTYMLGVLVSVLGVRGGDIFGSWLFELSGFVIPMIITTIATMLIAPALLVMPKDFLIRHKTQPGSSGEPMGA